MSCHDTSSLDYQEAFNRKGAAYIGSLKGELGHMLKKMNDTGRNRGMIFNPERSSRSDDRKWSYEKNINFIAGVIASRRPVILKPGKIRNKLPFKHMYIGITCHEIVWLIDNGYEYDATDKTHVIFSPPPNITRVILLKYLDNSGNVIKGNCQYKSALFMEFVKKAHTIITDIFYTKDITKSKNQIKRGRRIRNCKSLTYVPEKLPPTSLIECLAEELVEYYQKEQVSQIYPTEYQEYIMELFPVYYDEQQGNQDYYLMIYQEVESCITKYESTYNYNNSRIEEYYQSPETYFTEYQEHLMELFPFIRYN